MKRSAKVLISIVTVLLVIGVATAIITYDLPGTVFNKNNTGNLEKSAYLIGISHPKYPVDENDYLYAAEDAGNMKNFLKSSAGFNENQTVLKSDQNASKLEIENDLSLLDKNPAQKDLFIFYFAGHGDKVTSENAYIICPYDADESNINIIRGAELKNFTDKIKTEKIICIFDCCESGGLIKDMVENNPNSSRYVILTACNVGESAMEMQEVNEGIFTHYLIEAFKVKAADTNNNSWISIEEAFNFAKTETIKYGELNGGVQHPQIYDGNPGQEVELVKI